MTDGSVRPLRRVTARVQGSNLAPYLTLRNQADSTAARNAVREIAATEILNKIVLWSMSPLYSENRSECRLSAGTPRLRRARLTRSIIGGGPQM